MLARRKADTKKLLRAPIDANAELSGMAEIQRLFVLRCGPEPTETPMIGARVHVTGREGAFLVLRSDPERRIADLVPENGLHLVEESVPFEQIRVESGIHAPITYVRVRRRREAESEMDELAG